MLLLSRRTRLRRARALACAAALSAAVTAAAGPALAATAASASASGDVVLEGRGHGHGVGMTHDGALALGRLGRSAAEILERFYPGTELRAGSTGTVRVLVRDVVAPGPVAVHLPAGGTVRPDRGAVAGLPVPVPPGAVVRVAARGDRAVATVGGREVAAPGALLVVPATVSELSDGTRHRGVLRVVAGTRLRVVAHLDVEDYLRGMGEVRDSSWPAESLRAQAVAARTYALFTARHRPRDADFDLYADDRSQVYLGAQSEYAAMDAAVADTAGRVLRFEGRLINAVYSSNGGGVTASPVEGFGPTRVHTPYLRPVRYPTADPKRWTVRLTTAEVARRLDYPGHVTSVRVVRAGPSGRAVDVLVAGSAGARVVPGVELAERLRLRSTLFTVGRGAKPAPRESGSAVQPRVAPAASDRVVELTDDAAGRSRRVATGTACTLVAAVLTGLLGHGGRRPQNRGGSE